MCNRTGARLNPMWRVHTGLFTQSGEAAMLRRKRCDRLRNPAGQQHGGSLAQTHNRQSQKRQRNEFHLQLRMIE